MGPRDRAIDSISARGRCVDRALVLIVVGLMPVLAGCSSFSSPSSTGTAPATYQPAAAAAPASDPTASMTPYPSRSLTDLFTDDSRPSASTGSVASTSTAPSAPPRPGMPHPPSTYTASAPPYQTSPNGYDVSAGSAAAPPRPAPAAARDDTEESVPGYASQPLTDIFSK